MSSLDTGPNPNKGRQLLKRAAEGLIHQGATLLKPIADRGGVYAYEMSVSGQMFILVARGSPWVMRSAMINVVSTQVAILTIATMAPIPLVMACFMGAIKIKRHDLFQPRVTEMVSWKLHVPDEIRTKQLGTNVRDGIKMMNWDWTIGRGFEGAGSIASIWRQERERWEREKQEQPVATRLGRYA